MMLKPIILAAAGAAALMLGAAPAAAADLATLGCVTEQLPQQQREAYAASARTLGSDDVKQVSDETRAALDKAIDTCRKRFNWSADATDAVKYITMSDFAIPVLREAATAAGVDPDAVTRAILALTTAEIKGLATGDESAVAALLVSFEKHNVALGSQARQTAIFTLTVMVSRREYERARFAAN